MTQYHPASALAALALLASTMAAAAPPAERSGKAVVETVCMGCHATGVNGAPMISDRQAWLQRAARGLQDLTRNAITGVRNMPAHGGQAALTDLEVTRAVAYMVSGGTSFDSNKAFAPAHLRSGQQVVQERCQSCHQAGVGGAPKIASLDDWRPRLVNGVPALVRSAIGGHNAMPARGGMGNLSDPEIRVAIEYMFSLPAARPAQQVAVR